MQVLQRSARAVAPATFGAPRPAAGRRVSAAAIVPAHEAMGLASAAAAAEPCEYNSSIVTSHTNPARQTRSPIPITRHLVASEPNWSPTTDTSRFVSAAAVAVYTLAAADGIRAALTPTAEYFSSLGVPGWLVHWGHPGNMAVVLFAMGGYGAAYLGWQIRVSGDGVSLDKI